MRRTPRPTVLSPSGPGHLTRKDFLKGAIAAASLAAASPALAQRRRPNILLIVTDQERAWKTLPSSLDLPARRSLAERGVSFNQYQVNALACGPARACMYTGQHMLVTGVFDNPGNSPGRRNLDPLRFPTLGLMLQELGYYTAYKGKWHLSRIDGRGDHRRTLQAFGFNEWQHDGDYYGDALEGLRMDPRFVQDATEWLGSQAGPIGRHRPWLLCVNLLNPHDIMYADVTGRQNVGRPRSQNDMSPIPGEPPYDQDLGYDLPPSFPDSLGSKPRAHAAFIEHSAYQYGEIPVRDDAAWRRYQNYYFNCLRDVDRHIARILEALGASGEADRTIIVFTSDHGEMGGAHAMRNKGPMIYRENIDVPLVIQHPDIAGGTTCDAVCGSIDLVPTLLALAGVERPRERYPALKGYDLSSLLAAPRHSGPRAAIGNLLTFSAVHASNPLPYLNRIRARERGNPPAARFPDDTIQFDVRSFYRGLFDGRWRFARYFSPNDHQVPTSWEELVGRHDLELYNDPADPYGLQNLAHAPHQHRDLIMSLNTRLNHLLLEEVGFDDGRHMPDGTPWTSGTGSARRSNHGNS